MQRVYIWHRTFATEAIEGVKMFWESDPLFVDPEERAAYVQWAVPEAKAVHVPAIYEDVDETDVANPVSRNSAPARPSRLSGTADSLIRLLDLQGGFPVPHRTARILCALWRYVSCPCEVKVHGTS